MGTLGKYLSEAREARQIDLRDAAQQTRISINYLKALEEEDFSRFPGEVFVKGFLKNYSRFLRLDESEVMKKYEELKTAQAPSGAAADRAPVDIVPELKAGQRTLIEPLIWAGGILIILGIFFFTALPTHHPVQPQTSDILSQTSQTAPEPGLASPMKQGKLYLEVVALEDTWLLVRIDSSPQKKAVLKKGDTLVWTADERFQLSYASPGAIKLSLDGKELTVNEPKNVVVRDLTVTASGIVNRKLPTEYTKPKPKRQPVAQPASAGTTSLGAQQPAAASTPRVQRRSSSPAPIPAAPQAQEPVVSSPTKSATPE
jgi:transcriptional regulator with XRE-family HTH domain